MNPALFDEKIAKHETKNERRENQTKVTEIIENRKQKLMDGLLQLDNFTVVLNVYSTNVFL